MLKITCYQNKLMRYVVEIILFIFYLRSLIFLFLNPIFSIICLVFVFICVIIKKYNLYLSIIKFYYKSKKYWVMSGLLNLEFYENMLNVGKWQKRLVLVFIIIITLMLTLIFSKIGFSYGWSMLHYFNKLLFNEGPQPLAEQVIINNDNLFMQDIMRARMLALQNAKIMKPQEVNMLEPPIISIILKGLVITKCPGWTLIPPQNFVENVLYWTTPGFQRNISISLGITPGYSPKPVGGFYLIINNFLRNQFKIFLEFQSFFMKSYRENQHFMKWDDLLLV